MIGPRAIGMKRPGWERFDWLFQVLFIAAHMPLALKIPKYSSLLIWHSRFALALGVLVALRTRRFERVAYVAAYITGAEVYWRMRRAGIPWEFGKYAVILILAIAIIRIGGLARAGLPSLYFLLLLPSAALTLMIPDGEEARGMLSFNLSGPLALAVCAIFFSLMRFSVREMRWIYACLVAPIFGIGVVAAERLRLSAEEFGASSNWIASGGFGPNQVSAALGLGIVAVVLSLIIGLKNPIGTIAYGALILFLFRQCVITFSRGGLYLAVGSLGVAAFYLARDRRQRWRLVGAMAVLLPILFFVIWPRLEAVTAGAINERFRNVDSTGRDLLVIADLKSWAESPVLGLGPGMATANREKLFQAAASHTEYSRMLAEHGLLGLGSLVVLALMAYRNFRGAATRLGKALGAAMLAYSLLSMAVDGMRVAAISFAFGLGGARLIEARKRTAAAPAPPKTVALQAGQA